MIISASTSAMVSGQESIIHQCTLIGLYKNELR